MFKMVRIIKTRQEESFTCINLYRAFVNRAYVSNHVGNDSIFSTFRVFIVNHNPWNVLMRWVKDLSFFGHFNQILNSLCTCRAVVNIVPVHSVCFRTPFSTIDPVFRACFKANDKRKGLCIEVIFIDSACFN